jgi:PTH1 family peptidyl-tRNA hydrolase
MILIVGLGNPGEKYAKTRHNLGFWVLDEFLRKKTPVAKTVWQKDNLTNSLLARVGDLVLAKPQTMMNASGFAVARLTRRYTLDASRLWVVHDDIDLPLGKLKIRQGGASAGHKGVESIIKQLGTDQFVRFRLGISHPGPGSSEDEVSGYVLSFFSAKEKKEIKRLVKKTIKAIEVGLQFGPETAMSRFNQ